MTPRVVRRRDSYTKTVQKWFAVSHIPSGWSAGSRPTDTWHTVVSPQKS